MYNLLIVGAGYTGFAIAQYYRSLRQRVFAVTRTSRNDKTLEGKGMIPIHADITQPKTLQKIPPAHFIIISVAPDERDAASYQKIYVDGIGNFLRSLEGKLKPYLIVYLSSTGVYGEQRGARVDEKTEPCPDHLKGKILLKAEKQVLASSYPSIILRLAGIYGPGRNRIASIKQKNPPFPEEDGYMNFFHVQDVVNSIPVLLKKGTPGEVYLGCDDVSVKRSEFYPWLLKKIGKKVPDFFIASTEKMGKRCSNQKLKNLGLQLKYPSCWDGYSELISKGGAA